ncbi:MAG: PTS sugar transporter subunit IIA [Candidatus Omnitrophica bacterium]|nr:PTS sugar transporter subunit IIA [Candidatus Omnitrophota bacterium]
MRIFDYVNKDLINVHLKAHNNKAIISEIVDQLCVAKKLRNKKEILQGLLEREEKGTTGIGDHIAIPHARIEDLKEIVLFVGVSKIGVDFSSSDSKPVHLIILFLTPLSESGTHLKVLAKLAAMLSNKLFVTRLAGAATNDILYHLFGQGDIGKEGFSNLSKEHIYLELGTAGAGISEQEAKRRIDEYGFNQLRAIKKSHLLKKFIYNFTNLLAVLMWVGSVLAFLGGMPEIGWAIIVVIIINAIFSFCQEFKAEKAIEALRKMLPAYTRVIRAGGEKKILASELVPGDIIIIEEGDNIPADARLIEAEELRVNNSAFSGESKLSHKMAEGFENSGDFLWIEMPNLVFAGTSVATGLGKAVVIATGMSTEIGKIAYLTQTVKEELSPLQLSFRETMRLKMGVSLGDFMSTQK